MKGRREEEREGGREGQREGQREGEERRKGGRDGEREGVNQCCIYVLSLWAGRGEGGLLKLQLMHENPPMRS